MLPTLIYTLFLFVQSATSSNCLHANCSSHLDEAELSLLQSHSKVKGKRIKQVHRQGQRFSYSAGKPRMVRALPESIQRPLEKLYSPPSVDRLFLTPRVKKKLLKIKGFPKRLFSSSSSSMSNAQAEACLDELNSVTAFNGVAGSVAAIAEASYPYNQDFIVFTNDEAQAYQAINVQLQIYLTQSDLRASYVDLANDAGMPLVVLTQISNLQSTASFRDLLKPGCNDTCFDTVANQLKTEVSYLSLLYIFFAVYIEYYSNSNQNMYNALSDVQDWLSMADTELIPPPAKKDWMDVLLDSMSLSGSVMKFGMNVFKEAAGSSMPYAAVLGIFCDAISLTTYAVKTSEASQEYSDTVTYGGVTFTTTDMENGASAKALLLKQSFSDMYANYEQVAAWQMNEIAADWGKLQGFVVLNAQCPIGTTIVTPVLDEMYRSFQWIGLVNLMPSKYKVGYERDYQRETRRRVSGGCWSPSHVQTRTATALGANVLDTVDLAKTTTGTDSCYYIQSPRKMISATRNYWLSELNDDTKQPSLEFYSYFDDMITYYINPAFKVNFSSSLDAIAAACLYLPPARSSIYKSSLQCSVYGINLTVASKSDCNTGGCLSGDCIVLDLMSTVNYPYDPYENTDGGLDGNYSTRGSLMSCCVPYMTSDQATKDGCNSLFVSTHKEGVWCPR